MSEYGEIERGGEAPLPQELQGGRVLPIRLFPDPVLRRRARAVPQINDEVRRLARDMMATLRNARGVGLAAPQVGVLKRLVTLDVPGTGPLALVNPAVTRREGKRQVQEGCLSVPGYTGILTRAVRVSARYLDLHGGRLQLTAEELLAQAIEHEVDHLNGIMYMDHLKAHEDMAHTGVLPHEPHWHDVGYEVHAHHGRGREQDRATAEVLRSLARLSVLNSDARVEDASYDLSDGK